LSQGDLFAETEGYMLAIQGRVLPTRNYQKYILKLLDIEDIYRRCDQARERIEHTLNGCQSLTSSEYTIWHNNIAKIIHQKLALKCGLLKEEVPYYKYTPDTILESDTHKLLWDQTILTDRTIPYNSSDIVLTSQKGRITYLIDTAVPGNKNLTTTYTHKIQKYINLAEEIKRIWNQTNVFTIPVVLSSTGIIPKRLHQSLKKLNLQQNLYLKLQKACILPSCYPVRLFLQ
jgi:hypothetical protein